MVKKKSREAGRPAGSDSTRELILEKSRQTFATKGYNGTSVRSIAINAGVDPSTVIHFFGTKEGLFQAVIADMSEITEPVFSALEQGYSGEKLMRTYLEIWENKEANAAMSALIRAAFESEKTMLLFREAITSRFVNVAKKQTKDALDAEILIMQIVIMGMGRHLVGLPELSKSSITTISNRVGSLLNNLMSKT